MKYIYIILASINIVSILFVIIVFIRFKDIKSKSSVTSLNKSISECNMIDYFADNLQECKNKIEEMGYKCEVVSEEEIGHPVKFLSIKIDSTVEMKFQTNNSSRAVDIIKNKNKIKVKISLIGGVPNEVKAVVLVDYQNGDVALCDYNDANDFNTPAPVSKKDEFDRDRLVKRAISVKELNNLRDKAYSLYSDLIEIYNEKVNMNNK